MNFQELMQQDFTGLMPSHHPTNNVSNEGRPTAQ